MICTRAAFFNGRPFFMEKFPRTLQYAQTDHRYRNVTFIFH